MQDYFRATDNFRSGTETYKWNPVRFYFLNSPQVERFLDKSNRSPIRSSSPAVFRWLRQGGHGSFAMFQCFPDL